MKSGICQSCSSYNFQSLSLLCYCRCVLHDIDSKEYIYAFILVVYQSTRVEKQNSQYHKNKPIIGKNTTFLLNRDEKN